MELTKFVKKFWGKHNYKIIFFEQKTASRQKSKVGYKGNDNIILYDDDKRGQYMIICIVI